MGIWFSSRMIFLVAQFSTHLKSTCLLYRCMKGFAEVVYLMKFGLNGIVEAVNLEKMRPEWYC